jgi:hypothetical protein
VCHRRCLIYLSKSASFSHAVKLDTQTQAGIDQESQIFVASEFDIHIFQIKRHGAEIVIHENTTKEPFSETRLTSLLLGQCLEDCKSSQALIDSEDLHKAAPRAH